MTSTGMTGAGALPPIVICAADYARLTELAASVDARLAHVGEYLERELLRLDWPSRTLRVAFVHSVLGTPVEDRYVWRDAGWRLVEERFEGQGYGLPHAAAEGERWMADGTSTRLLLNRTVMPLVIRPLPAQDMRVQLDDGRNWRLGHLSTQAIELQARGC